MRILQVAFSLLFNYIDELLLEMFFKLMFHQSGGQ